jgi:hypothetical protein
VIDAVYADYLVRHRTVLLDTNLLILFILGRHRKTLIPRFMHTKQYSIEDFELLENLMRRFHLLITTPNILTEVSNLSGRLDSKEQSLFRDSFRIEIEKLEERHLASREAAKTPAFWKLGLTDSVVAATPGDFLVMTDDLALSGVLRRGGAGCDQLQSHPGAGLDLTHRGSATSYNC